MLNLNTGRKFKCIAVLVPIVLVLITVSTRYILRASDLPFGSAEQLFSRDNGTDSQPVPTVPVSAVVPTPFPQPWDSGIQQNFSTTTCLNFFANMTNTLPFRACRPLSLILQSSTAIFQAQKNLTLLNSIIWGTCTTTVPNAQCSANMAWFSQNLRAACAQEIADNNANVVDALTGLNAFDLMYSVGCLSDPSTNSYCYLDAVHNSNPADLYIYNLPLSALAYPNSTTPTCSACTKSILAMYANALTNITGSSLDVLAANYPSAYQINVKACGSSYAKSLTSSETSTIKAPIGIILLSTFVSVWFT